MTTLEAYQLAREAPADSLFRGTPWADAAGTLLSVAPDGTVDQIRVELFAPLMAAFAESSGLLADCRDYAELEAIVVVGIDLARPAEEKLPALLQRAFEIEIEHLQTIYREHQFRLN